jgi:hypothetical protein
MAGMPNPALVNFVIAGVMRGGTTALAHFLAQHPDVCFAPAKEVHFFDDPDFDQHSDPDEMARHYAAHFPNFINQSHVGEATPIYMYSPLAIERLARYNPTMNIILILRDPVQRALSHYNHAIAHQQENRSLTAALLLEKYRLWRDRKNWAWTSSLRRHSYLDRGYYGRQLNLLLRYFPAQQICVVRTSDLRDQHASTLHRVYHFLGLPDVPDLPAPDVMNVFGAPTTPTWLSVALRSFYTRDQRLLANLLAFHKIAA